jgi:hypothetical protein
MSICTPRIGLGKRSPPWYTPLRQICTVLAALVVVPVDAVACQPEDSPVLELQVAPAELAGARKPLTVAVFANHCARISLPEHYRRHGEYVVALNAEDRSRLEARQLEHQAAPYDHKQMLAQSRQIEVSRIQGSAVEHFEVHDADHYTLTVHNNDRTSTTRALAIFQYAERYPEIRSLKALQHLAAALIDISERDDLIAIDKANEHKEARP